MTTSTLDITGTAARAVQLSKVYGAGRHPGRRPRRVSRRLRPRAVHRDHGPVGLRQVDPHALPGRARPMPPAAQVLIGDTDLTSLNDKQLTRLRRDRIGFIFQSFNLLPTLTALENITLPAGHRRPQARPGLARRRSSTPSACATGSSTGPTELSGGQQQRVAVRPRAGQPAARSSSPTSRPATSTRRAGAEVLGFLRRSVDELGQTVVMVTHDPVAAAYADRVVFLADGRIVDEMRRPDRRVGAGPDEAVSTAGPGVSPVTPRCSAPPSRACWPASCGWSLSAARRSCSASRFVVGRLRAHRHPGQDLRRPVHRRQQEHRRRRARRRDHHRPDRAATAAQARRRSPGRHRRAASTASRRRRARSSTARLTVVGSTRTARSLRPAARRPSASTGSTPAQPRDRQHFVAGRPPRGADRGGARRPAGREGRATRSATGCRCSTDGPAKAYRSSGGASYDRRQQPSAARPRLLHHAEPRSSVLHRHRLLDRSTSARTTGSPRQQLRTGSRAVLPAAPRPSPARAGGRAGQRRPEEHRLLQHVPARLRRASRCSSARSSSSTPSRSWSRSAPGSSPCCGRSARPGGR